MKIVSGLVYAVFAIASAASIKLPKGFIQCKKSDPKFDECIKNALQSSVPQLIKGVPSLGLITSDPYRIASLNIEQGIGPVSVNMNFTDLIVSNMKYTIIDSAHYDPKSYRLNVETHVPNSLLMEGDYEVNGKVLILPIVGKGRCKFIIDVLKFTGNVEMKPVFRKEQMYLEVANLTWTFIPINFHVQLDNLFNGNKALGDHMNVFLNENWREVLSELQPAIEEVFGALFTSIGQQFLNRVPENQIFLD
ncbi:Haemolymph juvenile hormone binding [Cinara cedri]|uniref:Haemolymph juvenile hormone binding n=1 Tax=Cinara cedri TaxID=506608 RepID=A0A5E4NAJ6_9HEMI|nr:Haemolymph juvenile hormone binding [Cinara cedri]